MELCQSRALQTSCRRLTLSNGKPKRPHCCSSGGFWPRRAWAAGRWSGSMGKTGPEVRRTRREQQGWAETHRCTLGSGRAAFLVVKVKVCVVFCWSGWDRSAAGAVPEISLPYMYVCPLLDRAGGPRTQMREGRGRENGSGKQICKPERSERMPAIFISYVRRSLSATCANFQVCNMQSALLETARWAMQRSSL